MPKECLASWNRHSQLEGSEQQEYIYLCAYLIEDVITDAGIPLAVASGSEVSLFAQMCPGLTSALGGPLFMVRHMSS